MKQRWHILGAGSIGCLWACNLVSMGYPVTLLLRNPEKLDIFNSMGAITLAEKRYSVSAELTDTSTDIDQLLITTKSTDTATALQSIKKRLSKSVKVIVLQNGLGSQHWVKDQLPDAEIAWASTTDGVWTKTPFNLVHAGQGITRIGSPITAYAWLAPLENGFLKVEQDEDIALTLWRKLAINCAINPLTAVYQCKNGELINNPDYLATMAAICKEVELVAESEGIELFDGPLIEQACHVAELTAENYSSMMQDIQHQRITEISHITGYLCERAKQNQLHTPTNDHYLKKIKKLHENIKTSAH